MKNLNSGRYCKIDYCTYPPGLVIGGGRVIVQFFGTFGLFSRDAIGLRGSKSKLL